MRTFVIGDIHGCYDELIALTKSINLKDEDLLVSLGDIVDRGNKSKEVYEYFKNRPNSIVLMGNHERKHLNGILSYAQEIVKVQFGEQYAEFIDWLKTLNYYHETDDALIIHAFFEHDKKIQEQKEEVLSGSTSGDRYLEKKYAENTYWNEYYRGKKPIIYGHHVVGDHPKIINNTYGIDTGSCHGNYLTAIELPLFQIHQVKAQKDYWIEEQKKWQIPVLKNKNWNEMTFIEIDKQLTKLAYIEDEEIIRFLNDLREWKNQLQKSLKNIKEMIDTITESIMKYSPDAFNVEAKKYSFNRYMYKSRSNRLEVKDLEKYIDTPQKILDLQIELKNIK
ncbi:metallophosphoesterase [Chryseobacterium capnotolerans]|uniref:metallophosphoesterase n=1 Tax=Chryseobacterium TaxID=59732 RepID=UPI00083AB963|nr:MULTISPECIES: metallophosphoesterase [Chryseobacterium]UHO38874.1 metallophosphoesterase [Chryseobacterium capnotolerans]